MAAQPDGAEKPFHIVSPILESLALSRAAGTKVYMKLENIQPTGSFKIRGIGRLCQEAAKKGCRRFVCSSGNRGPSYGGMLTGNVGSVCHLPEPRFPQGGTPAWRQRTRPKSWGCRSPSWSPVPLVPPRCANWRSWGRRWRSPARCGMKPTGEPWSWHRPKAGSASTPSTTHRCGEFCQGSAPASPSPRSGLARGILCPPPPPPNLCSSPSRQGHASLVRELKDSLETKPDAVLLAVGGGGLLAGVVAGLRQVGWQDVPVVAAETRGAHSFHAALAAGRLVSLPDITSVAKCLGAKKVAARALECARECQVISQVVEDAEAVRAVERFLDDERMLVQPACGAALALLYAGRLQRLQREGRLRTPLDSVVVVVCGGGSIQAAQLQALKNQLGLE
uniref:L-serine ammonia-lyase n=1 Tax=Accipiter nisus TaxID=211598 RepID=A0A8B9NH61_9AVES